MPPFGFGMSIPNLRKVSAAAPAPVTLVQENWVGSGSVSGRTRQATHHLTLQVKRLSLVIPVILRLGIPLRSPMQT